MFDKITEPMLVAYSRFRGLVNAPSRIWMVRDWASREGYHLIGAPRCIFHFNGADADMLVCEVQWRVAEDLPPSEGEVGVRWLAPQRVIATYHQGDTVTLDVTARGLRAWGEAQGLHIAPSPCEIYWFDVRAPREHWITEIQFPVEEDSHA